MNGEIVWLPRMMVELGRTRYEATFSMREQVVGQREPAEREPPGCFHYHMAANMIHCARRLLWAAAETVRDRAAAPPDAPAPEGQPLVIEHWPEETPPIEESVRGFVPTAARFKQVDGPDAPRVLMDTDHAHRPRFVSSFYLMEEMREIDSGMVKRQAGRAYLAPPALPVEADRRAELLASTGKGIPLGRSRRTAASPLSGKLTDAEKREVATIAIEEQLALIPILAAGDGLAILISPRGDWPRSDLVRGIAERLACRIARFSLRGVPSRALRSLRHIRYDAVTDEGYVRPNE